MDHFDFSEIEHDDRYGWAEKPIVSVFLQESFYYAQNGVNGSIVETTCLPCTYLFVYLFVLCKALSFNINLFFFRITQRTLVHWVGTYTSGQIIL